jgi:mRNA interferase MazF
VTVRRYDVYWVDLNPVIGIEIAKTIAAVVISDNDMNRLLETIVVCPITSRLHPRWPSRVQTEVDGRPAEVAVDKILTVSKRRIGSKIDTLDKSAAEQIRHVVTEMYGVLADS